MEATMNNNHRDRQVIPWVYITLIIGVVAGPLAMAVTVQERRVDDLRDQRIKLLSRTIEVQGEIIASMEETLATVKDGCP